MTDKRDPILRISASHRDINANGHIFGGWVLSQMDIAGGIIAGEVCQGPCATVAIEGMAFLQPILVRDIVSVYGEVIRRDARPSLSSWMLSPCAAPQRKK